ncbi:thiosulfate sulfurtransferase [archaeon BMS3Bbin15]|nr:thiosulfate sulfurtransferase [archaeon BMS3Bbin15]
MARITMKISLVVALLLFSVLSFSQVAAATGSPGPLVSTSWVAQNLQTIENPNQTQIRLVEVSKSSYASWHIPGAVHVKWGSEVFGAGTDHMVLDYSQMEQVLKKLGVTPDTRIVIYADGLDQATRFYWTLKYWNIADVSIMNGEKSVWKTEGRPTSTVVPAVKQLDYPLKYPPNTKIDALLHPDVMYGLATGKVLFVDTRPASYFNGQKIAVNKWERAGHIPGAVDITAPEGVTKDGKLLSDAELKTIFESKGVTPDKDIITYCNTGVRASLGWFILQELLGYPNVKNYDGSMREYANAFYLPMEPSSFDVYKNFPQSPINELKASQDSMNAKISAAAKTSNDVALEVKGFASKQFVLGSYIIAIIAIIVAVAGITKKK